MSMSEIPPCTAALSDRQLVLAIQTERSLMRGGLRVHAVLRVSHVVRYIAHQECLAQRTGARYDPSSDEALDLEAQRWVESTLQGLGHSWPITDESK